MVSLVVRGGARDSRCKETPPLDCLSRNGTHTAFSPPREPIFTLLRLKALARSLLPILLLTSGLAQAQTAPSPSADIQRERVEQLKELLRTKKDLQDSILTMQQTMQQQLAEFDARIAALEASLGVTPSQDERPQGELDAIAATAAASTAAYATASDPGPHEVAGPPGEVMGFPYESPLGFVLARGPNGEVHFSTKGYVRYLNQLNLDKFYTDAFGRTIGARSETRHPVE